MEHAADGMPVFHIFEALDIGSAPKVFQDIRKVLAAGEPGPFVVSMNRCPYCDTTCLSGLVALHHDYPGRMFVSVPEGTNVRRVLEITNLVDILRLYSSVEDALAAAEASR